MRGLAATPRGAAARDDTPRSAPDASLHTSASGVGVGVFMKIPEAYNLGSNPSSDTHS